jgi:hypothetical protein
MRRRRLAAALAATALLALLGAALAVPVAASGPERTRALTVVAGAPIERPAPPGDPGPGDGAVEASPPPTSVVTAADADRAPTTLGAIAFVVLAFAVAVTTPLLAIRRRRTR